MQFTKVFPALVLAALAITGTRARSQANVTENQSATLYVDGKNGSDTNAGTTSSPLKTIQAAISKANANNQKRIGTRVIVNPGIYREAVSINPVSNQTTVPLTVQAAVTGTAIIAGSDVLTNWSTDPGYPSAYTTTFSPDKSTCSLPSGWPNNFAPIALRTEMIFVNGTPLTQVATY